MNPLIQVAELQNLLDSATTAPLVLDVRFTLGRHDGREAYERGHIPGSHWVDLENDLAGPPTPGRAGRHPLPNAQDFTAAMRVAGVSNDSTVVITDADNALAASRLWWMLTDAGHTDVRVLDGGFRAWTAAGSDVAEGPDTLPNPGDFDARPGQRRVVEGAEVEQRAEGCRLVDVRAPERYRGESEPMDAVAGHIPGAVNLPSAENFTPEGRFLPSEVLRGRFEELNEGDIVYCGSGITAAQTVLAAEVAGIRGLVLYSGSWSDWITEPDREIATGDGTSELEA